MNNLPSNLTRHTVFRDNDYNHTLVFPDTYVLPAVEDMSMQVRRNTVIVDDVDAVITKDGQRVTFTYPKEDLALIPGYNFQYFLIDGKSILGGELMVVIGVGEQDVTETQVIIEDGNVTTVIVPGLDLVADQVSAAQQAAQEAEAAKDEAIATSADKIPTMSITELKALDISPVYTAVGISDVLKEGTFYSDNSTTLPVDDVLVIQDAQGNKWVRKNYDYLKAEWFGAKGDGATDDTVALQSFFDKAGSTGSGVIKMTSGRTYVFTEVNMSTPFATLQGDRAALKGKISIGGILATEYNIRINTVNFDTEDVSIQLNKCRRVCIQDNDFRNADKAIHCPVTSGFHAIAQIDINTNRFVDVEYAWVSEASAWDVLSDCYFAHNIVNSARVTAVQLTGIDGLTAVDNTFFFSNTVGIREAKEHHFKITVQSDWVIFAQNKFFEAGYESLYLERCRHLSVVGNHFARSGQRLTRSTIYLTGDPDNTALEKPTWLIAGNECSLFSKDFVEVDPNTYGKLSVVGNTVNYNNFFAQYFGPDTLSALIHYTYNTGPGKNAKIPTVEVNNTPPVETNHLRSSGNVSVENRSVADFNAINGQGWMVSTSTPTNGPGVGFTEGFRVYVDNNTFSYKDFFNYLNDWYKRSGTTSVPGTWYKMLDMQNVKSSLQDSFLTSQIALTNATSLDTFQTQGIYVRGSDSGNTAALGYPYDGIQKGILTILRWDANNISQQYSVSNGDAWMRYFTGSTWSAWKLMTSDNRASINQTYKTADYNPTATDRTILFDATSGARLSVLPTSASTYINGRGQKYTFKKMDASVNTVTVDGNLAETIEGAANVVLTTQGHTLEIQSIGTGWIILYKNF